MYTIYMHRNKINGKVYIGQTNQNPEYRWKRNGKGYETCEIMWKAINKYGWINFEHIILKENLTLEEANFYEMYYIDKFNSTNKKYGYNIRKGGNNSPLKDSTKEKLSKLFKGENHPLYGKHHSTEVRRKISLTKSFPVLQFSKDNKFLAEYESAKTASKLLGICYQNISLCCKKNKGTAGGYIWKYKN